MKFKKTTGSLLIALSSLLAVSICEAGSSTSSSIASKKPSSSESILSYSLGNIIGTRIKNDFKQVNNSQALHGLDDALSGAKPALTQNEMKKAIDAAQKEQMQKLKAKRDKEAKANAIKSKKFLEENAKMKGVKTTATGLQYKNITNELTKEDKKELMSYLKTQPKQSDVSPNEKSKVKVTYIGMFTDKNGKKKIFDATSKRKRAAELQVDQVIPGWQEGLKLMKVGQSYELFVPPKLGYGETGIPGIIPGNSVLTFKVTLLKVENAGKSK